ncbi:Calreticulin family-domain-containing protein, partial [Protomyces lactucae-debilis]
LSTFTPTAMKAPFLEQFADASWEQRWNPSAKTSGDDGHEEMNYVGRWNVEEPTVYKGMEGDAGLVLKDDARRHAISSAFKKSFDNKDGTLVLQYEVKMQKGLECGGAYLKLLTVSPEGIAAKEFSGDTPYTIMFGPDKCGATNKIHFIFRHLNPITKKYEEKHLTSPPTAKISKLSTLYTLIVKPDQTFDIKVNNKSVKKGSLLEDFTPSVNPSKEIDDPSDKKPETWVDEAEIDDPTATKPDDWDEDAPEEIEDAEAVKPEGWQDDEPQTVADPEATKPADWDDEEDGTWLAPTIQNPKCSVGCGPWKRPMIKNPAYKGPWSAPKIDNPAYKGEWSPAKIPNPDYYEDLTPANFEPMSGIGFELWTMQGDILFDNILLTHDESQAQELSKDWQVKFKAEEAQDNAANAAASDEAKDKFKDTYVSSFLENPLGYVKQEVGRFIQLVQVDPVYAVKELPQIAGGLIAALVTLLALLGSLVGVLGAGAPAVKKAGKKAETKAVTLKEKVASEV